MAKAGTYANDGTIVGGDKWIGTDAEDGSTKNYTASGVETYMKTNSGVDGGDNFVGETSVQTITNKTINDSTFEYDNTSSGLTATDVESAINELASEKQDISEKGLANGYASLDGSAKVPTSQLPNSVLETLSYQGTWDAALNNPTIPTASSGNKGDYYVVSTAGSTNIDGITDWKVGDWIVSNSVSWDKIDNTGKVSSVNGFTGVVVLDKNDIGLENVDNTSDADKPVSTAQATALGLKINKDTGIELYSSKRAVRLDGSALDDLNLVVNTGIYEGQLNLLQNAPSSFSGIRASFWVSKMDANGDYITQFAVDGDGEKCAIRSRIGGVWGDWEMILTETDKTELLGKINKLSIEDIDLSDPAIWTPSTKTLDLSSKEGVGIINFNTPAPNLSILNISSSEIAKVTMEGNVDLIQNGSRIQFNSIQGQQVFTQLNSGTYMAMNVDYQNKTFDIRKGDNSGWVDTSFNFIVDILDISSSSTAQVTVTDGNLISENQEIKIINTEGMESLWGNTYYVFNLDQVEGTFDLSTTSDILTPVDTSAETYQQNGILVEDSIYSYAGDSFVNFENDNVVIEIDSIVGLDNGTQVKFSASDNNEIGFNPTAKASAVAGDIVSTAGTLSANTLDNDGLYEILVHKDLNWIAHRNGFV